MKYELIQEPNLYLTPKEQIAVNRGIKLEDVEHYFNTTEKDIISYHFLNEEQLNKAAISIINSIKDSKQTLIIVDSDFDGYCSSSLFINYFYHFFPTWIKNCVKWIHHDSKSHGINDLLENILSMDTKPSLLIVPDAGTNDIEAHKILSDNGIEIIVLDHHLAEYTNEELFKNATIINNQICEYENKNLCGTGIVWQFCRYIDTMFICEEERYAEHFLDLVAAANTADMMSLLSFETKHLIKTGLKTNNIHNHLIYRLWGKSSYKIGEELTSIDLAFYIAPLVNAVTRVGTLQEKEAVFNSMLDIIEDESYISEAANICIKVRNRQVRIVNNAVEKIVPSLENKFITILLDETESEIKNVTGLIATKFSSKYNKPVLVLIKNIVDNKIRYSGSARGSDISGVNTFKDLCGKTELCEYAQGHQSAFGISILEENISLFKDRLNKLLEPYDTESKYYVDYIFDGWSVIDPDLVLEIGSMKKDWGKDFRESLILIKDLKVNEDMITIMGKSSKPTIKITMPCGIPIIYFNTKPEEINRIITKGYVKMNIVCTCNINNWLGKLSPQLFLKDYEIIEESPWYF